MERLNDRPRIGCIQAGRASEDSLISSLAHQACTARSRTVLARKTHPDPGIEEFFNDARLTRLIDQALVGHRELKILIQDVKEQADEPRGEIYERQAYEARDCESDCLRHAAGSAGLWNPQSPSGGAGSSPAGKLSGRLQ